MASVCATMCAGGYRARDGLAVIGTASLDGQAAAEKVIVQGGNRIATFDET